MAVRVRARDGSVQTFPDGTSPASIRMAMLAYDNKEEWGGLAGRVGEAVGQATEPSRLALPKPSEVDEIEVTAPRPTRSVGHPGFAESLIPVWGSGREAIADFQEGDLAGGILNTVLAGSDLFLGASVAKGLAKGGAFAVKGMVGRRAAPNWRNLRSQMEKRGLIEKGQHGHHWLIPQNKWGKHVPDIVKNHPLNIKPMPTVARVRDTGRGVDYLSSMHGRLDNQYMGLQRFNPAQRYWYGTPDWWKAANAKMIGHPAEVIDEQVKR